MYAQLALKLGANALASFAVGVLSATVWFNLLSEPENYLLIGVLCSSIHILLFARLRADVLDFCIQGVSVFLFMGITGLARLGIMGL